MTTVLVIIAALLGGFIGMLLTALMVMSSEGKDDKTD